MPPPTLPAIAALARAGAAGRAWELFVAGGHDQRSGDPAALAVKGRLLKGQARLALAQVQPTLFAAAAQAYAAANALTPAPYLAINAATSRLLAGDQNGAMSGAAAVLALLDAPDPPADTPYFLAATRAEAWLLLGDQSAAETAMIAAARADPDGWADRATTICQLREIAAAQAGDQRWIAGYEPPPSLHFAGHMGLASGGAAEAALTAALDHYFADHPAGFAWGALAAGADIVIAEQLLARGAALHVVLPCPPEKFAAQSVAPAGAAWSARFDTVLSAAASVRWASAQVSSVHDPLATAHAGELAIGGALINAATLASRAAQLIVFDETGGGRNTARQAELWRPSFGPQHCLTVSRDVQVEAMFPPELPDPARVLAVHLAVIHDALKIDPPLPPSAISALADPVSAVLAAAPPGAVRAEPGLWTVTLTSLDQALALAAQLTLLSDVAVGLHLAIGPVLRDAASGALVAYGPAPAAALRLARLAPPGVTLASDMLAVTLAARGKAALRSELYHLGEEELGGAVHALIVPPGN